MKLISCCIVLIVGAFSLPVFAAELVVSNVRASQRSNTTLVDVFYDLAGDPGDEADVDAIITDSAIPINTPSLSGAVGEYIQPGQNLHIIWDAGADWPGNHSEFIRVDIAATPSSAIVGTWIDDFGETLIFSKAGQVTAVGFGTASYSFSGNHVSATVPDASFSGAALGISANVNENTMSGVYSYIGDGVVFFSEPFQATRISAGGSLTSSSVFEVDTQNDLVAITLYLNSDRGGIDFSFTSDKPTSVATTAKLFWANGTTAGNQLPGAAIFTHNIPAGFSGDSGRIHVPASAFASQPEGATHALLVIDPENLEEESNESNNTGGIEIPLVQIRWPNGTPVTSREFLIGGYLVTTDGNGELNWADVRAAAVNTQHDVVYFTTATTRAQVEFPSIDRPKVTSDGFYVLDLCEEANAILTKMSKWADFHDLYKAEESANRTALETEYKIEFIVLSGKYYIAPQTATVQIVNVVGDIVKAFESRTWQGFLKDLACAGFESQTFPGLCSLADKEFKKFALGEIVYQTYYQIFRNLSLVLDPDHEYSTYAKAHEARENFRLELWAARKELQSRYNQQRKNLAEYNELWNAWIIVPQIVRAKAREPKQRCIDIARLDKHKFPPQQLDEFPTPNTPNPTMQRQEGCVTWLGNSATTTLPCNRSLPQPQRLMQLPALSERSYVWTKMSDEGVEIVGTNETFTVPSFAASDAGVYRRTEFDELGEVLDVQTFGLYSADASVTPPAILSTPRELLAFQDTSFIYTPNVVSTGITAFAWMKDGVNLPDTIPHLFISSAADLDEGTYSVVVENAGGAVTNEVLHLRILEEALDSIEWAAGELQVSILTETNVTYYIEESTNMNTWVQSGISVNGDGGLHLEDVSTEGADAKFIRISAEPTTLEP